jgi:hypothetical protein
VQAAATEADASSGPPFVAKLVQESAVAAGGGSVRRGSPFRRDAANPTPVSTNNARRRAAAVAAADYGPFLYTAMGAAAAAVLTVAFAIAGLLWFPIGGVLVAALGSLLAVTGLLSPKRFRWAALLALPAHLALFFVSYARALA